MAMEDQGQGWVWAGKGRAGSLTTIQPIQSYPRCAVALPCWDAEPRREQGQASLKQMVTPQGSWAGV